MINYARRVIEDIETEESRGAFLVTAVKHSKVKCCNIYSTIKRDGKLE